VLIFEGETHSAAETVALGRCLGESLAEPAVWCLDGDLGSGKTVLARGILRGLGVAGAVRSPTFTLAIPHTGRWPAVHVDLYRLESAAAIEMLDWDAWLGGDTVVLVEWGARARRLIGPERLDVELAHSGDDRRRLRIVAGGRLAGRIGAALRTALGTAGEAQRSVGGRPGSPDDGEPTC
jgi:tRNA threonylcarbamoyladenosine biosynthesis protein TsaE